MIDLYKLKFTIFCLILLSILLSGCDNRSSKIETKYKDDWAFFNYGQSIDGVNGEEGVDIDVIPAWKISQGNPNIVVAVVDTGVDSSCNILKDRLLYNAADKLDGNDNDSNGYIDDYFSWDFFNNSNDLFNDYLYDYHGTYICTTIARAAPKIKILPVKFMESSSGSTKNAILALKYAINRGAKIINCSWNFQKYNDELYTLMANNPNILFICSAGNSNINLDKEKLYPCSYNLDNIITVAAIDNNGEIYKASGYGNTANIAAPGWKVNVVLPEDDTTYIDGTSVATSFVSAAAALLYSINNSLKPKDIKDYIINSAHKIDTLKLKCSSGGYLDIKESLDLCKSELSK